MKTFHHYLIYFKHVILAKKFDRFLHLGLHLNNPSVQVHPYKWKKNSDLRQEGLKKHWHLVFCEKVNV